MRRLDTLGRDKAAARNARPTGEVPEGERRSTSVQERLSLSLSLSLQSRQKSYDFSGGPAQAARRHREEQEQGAGARRRGAAAGGASNVVHAGPAKRSVQAPTRYRQSIAPEPRRLSNGSAAKPKAKAGKSEGGDGQQQEDAYEGAVRVAVGRRVTKCPPPSARAER